MEIYSLDEIMNLSFNLTYINALRQNWQSTKSFRCIGAPKKQNLLLYLDGCRITYTDKDNRVFTAESGDVVYTPKGSEYRAELSDFSSQDSHTVGINFLLYDEAGRDIILSQDIKVFHTASNQAVRLLFEKAPSIEASSPLIRRRILLMELICELSAEKRMHRAPENIAVAVQYLNEHIEDAPTVSTLASLAGLSEVYFRKQFKAHIGYSPCEYRNALRLSRARSYLEYGEISVQEISDTLGYSTVSHFIKEFKRHYGTSPLRYRSISKP